MSKVKLNTWVPDIQVMHQIIIAPNGEKEEAPRSLKIYPNAYNFNADSRYRTIEAKVAFLFDCIYRSNDMIFPKFLSWLDRMGIREISIQTHVKSVEMGVIRPGEKMDMINLLMLDYDLFERFILQRDSVLNCAFENNTYIIGLDNFNEPSHEETVPPGTLKLSDFQYNGAADNRYEWAYNYGGDSPTALRIREDDQDEERVLRYNATAAIIKMATNIRDAAVGMTDGIKECLITGGECND